MLDDSLLADPHALLSLDTGGVLRSAATAGAQVRSAAQGAIEAGVDDLSGQRPRALVFVRRPGASTSAAAVLAALLGPTCPVPVVLVDAVPSWIGPLDVVVAHTADGTDGALADSVALAVRRGAEVVLSSPGTGPVASAGAGRARLVEPRIPVPPGLDLPRALTVGVSVLRALGLLGAPLDRGMDVLADLLDGEAERNQPGHEPFMNPAKALAMRMAEHTPLLWGADAPAAAVAAHAASALATHAGVVGHAADVGQGVTATALLRSLDSAGGRDIFHDPFADPVDGPEVPPARLFLLATDEEDPAAAVLRRTGRRLPESDLLHPVDEVLRGTPHAVLLRTMLLASRLDIASVYLGLATRAIAPA